MKSLKKIIIASAFLALIFGFTKSNVEYDQFYSEINRSYSWTQDLILWTPVYCDGELVDLLTGPVTAHFVAHVKDGEIVWYMFQMFGEVESDLNGEVFTVHEKDKGILIPSQETYTYHVNLVGNMGSHYINKGTVDYETGEITVDFSVCPEN